MHQFVTYSSWLVQISTRQSNPLTHPGIADTDTWLSTLLLPSTPPRFLSMELECRASTQDVVLLRHLWRRFLLHAAAWFLLKTDVSVLLTLVQ
jgi:hypothetical protein